MVLVGAIAALTILATPECFVERQALQFDTDRYLEDLDPEICDVLVGRIDSHNAQCGGDMETLDCG